MSRWYRAYDGTATDPKFGEIALAVGCSRSVALATWQTILESCAATNDGGRFIVTPRRCAVILAEPMATIEAVFAEMTAMGMLAATSVCAWSKRQYESDSSTERSRKHRERRRSGLATLQGRSATPPDTDTDTEYSEPNGSDASASRILPPAEDSPSPTDWQTRLWREGTQIFVEMTGMPEPAVRKLIGKWRKTAKDDCRQVLRVLEDARDHNPSDPIPWIEGALRNRGKPPASDIMAMMRARH